MSIIELRLADVRCITAAQLELAPTHNLVWGRNGSGKTTLLESLFLLGRGRSFRTRNGERLIRHGQQQLVVFGRTDDLPPRQIGIEVRRSHGTSARINGSDAQSLAELSQAFPVQVIDPGVHKLLEEGAHRRRRWLDWAVFHVEPVFAGYWTRYTRTVRQRNAALKHQPHDAWAWDAELARLGEWIATARQGVLDQLAPFWAATVARLSQLDASLQYHRGWTQGASLAEALQESRTRDALRGMTHSGPHRADVVVRLGSRLAREVLSRGQQKLIAIAMILAQIRLLQEAVGLYPTLLLDDPGAELDSTYLREFIGEVQQLGCQLVLTALAPDSDPFGMPERVFHVEQGQVTVV